MVHGCGNNMIKLLMFAANLVIFVFGGLIFGFSLWSGVDEKFTDHFQQLAKQLKLEGPFLDNLSQYQASLWVLVAVGALLFVVGFLGCCGAGCESPVFLTLFSVVVLILSLIELATLVFLFSNRGAFLESVQKVLIESAKTETGRSNLLPIENMLHCCGATSETRYLYKDQCAKVPELADANDCYSVFSESLETVDKAILGFGIVLLVSQSFAMIFSCTLLRAFRERVPLYYG